MPRPRKQGTPILVGRDVAVPVGARGDVAVMSARLGRKMCREGRKSRKAPHPPRAMRTSRCGPFRVRR